MKINAPGSSDRARWIAMAVQPRQGVLPNQGAPPTRAGAVPSRWPL